MEELIAKKYIKAMTHGLDIAVVKNMTLIFSTLADSFKDEEFVNIINNPYVDDNDKLVILLESVKAVKSNELDNFIKLIVENKRINIIPSIAEEMRKNLAKETKTYQGVVYSDTAIDKRTVNELGKGLSKKFDSKITLTFVKNDFSGIKVDVEDIGVEINFSKSRINTQMIEHILKAI
ncbi:MAG: F0F1 ATP synthase subunit delta [Campylobacterota bacterium]|nr:F0F1 ATP synthase subunit delta [Campylobacterota bacterium]